MNKPQQILSAAGILIATGCGASVDPMKGMTEGDKKAFIDTMTEAGLPAEEAKKLRINVASEDEERRVHGTMNAVKGVIKEACHEFDMAYTQNSNYQEQTISGPMEQIDKACERDPLSLAPEKPARIYTYDSIDVAEERVQFVDLEINGERVLVVDRDLLRDEEIMNFAEFMVRDSVMHAYRPFTDSHVESGDISHFTPQEQNATQGFVIKVDEQLERSFDVNDNEEKVSDDFSLEVTNSLAANHLEWDMPTVPGAYEIIDRGLALAFFELKEDGSHTIKTRDNLVVHAQPGLTNAYPLSVHHPKYVKDDVHNLVYEYLIVKDDKIVFISSDGKHPGRKNVIKEDGAGEYNVGPLGSTYYFPIRYEDSGVIEVEHFLDGKMTFSDFIKEKL